MRIYQHIFIIRTDKPADLRLIITTLQIIHACLIIIIVPLISVWIILAKCLCHAACDTQLPSPAIISVVYYSRTVGVNKPCNGSQIIPDVVIITFLI